MNNDVDGYNDIGLTCQMCGQLQENANVCKVTCLVMTHGCTYQVLLNVVSYVAMYGLNDIQKTFRRCTKGNT